jgi:hypothetical protein
MTMPIMIIKMKRIMILISKNKSLKTPTPQIRKKMKNLKYNHLKKLKKPLN